MSNKLVVSDILNNSLKILPTLLSKSWLTLLILTIPFNLVQQYLMSIASDQSTPEDMRIWVSVIAMIFGFFESLFILLIVPKIAFDHIQKKSNGNMGAHIKKNLKQLIIEILRGWGSIAVGLLKLLIPGFKRMVQYMFIPFIVQFNPEYEKGQIDALEHSKKLTSGNFARILLICLICFVLVIGAELLVMRWNFFVSPLTWVLGIFVYITMEILTGYILCLTYVKLERK